MDENAIQQLWWARAQTITTFVGLLVIVMNVFSLMYDRIVRLKALDSGKRASDAEEMGPFRSPKLSSWSAFRGYITKTPRITTVSGLIEAGDDNLWSSAAVDHLQSQHGNLSWVPLYEAVYTQISKHHAADGRLIDATKDPAISLALQRSRLGLSGTGNERFRLHDNSKLINCLRHLDKTTEPPKEDNPRRGKAKGLTRLSNAWMLAGAPCVESSREELVSLALVLGVSLNINDFTQNISGVGPFGTGFDVIQDNGVWKLELIHGSRLPRHAASRSSGYSVLFAKHLAFGSLPFAENSLWVSSIYINPKVLQAIKAGHAIMDGKSFGGRPLQVLRSLAAAKQINAYYHTGDDELDGDLLGCITNSNNATVTVKLTSTNTTVHANWCRAVVGIAFGGLVPQASRDLSTAVAFTVGIDSSQDAIGDVVGDVVDALENLINNLHQCDSGANIFGDYVSERCEALQLIDFVHYATPSRYDTQEAAAVFARYMNLLERMTALSKDRVVDGIYEGACELVHKVYVEMVLRARGQSGPNQLLDRNLATEINKLAQSFHPHQPDVKVTLNDCTLIVWSILVVWAARVPHSESEDFKDEAIVSEEESEKRVSVRNGAPHTKRHVSLTDLPQLLAFS